MLTVKREERDSVVIVLLAASIISCWPIRAQRSNDVAQTCGVYGFHQMIIKSRLPAAPAIFVLAIPGYRNQEHAGAVGRASERTCDFVAVHAGQSNIQQYSFGMELLRQLDRFSTI